jgi:hypothetical protein
MISYKDLIPNQKYLLLGFNTNTIAYFSHVEYIYGSISRAYFKDLDDDIWIVPFLSLVPVIPISSLEAELI